MPLEAQFHPATWPLADHAFPYDDRRNVFPAKSQPVVPVKVVFLTQSNFRASATIKVVSPRRLLTNFVARDFRWQIRPSTSELVESLITPILPLAIAPLTNGETIGVPNGYDGTTELGVTMTFAGLSFDSMGITPRTYEYSSASLYGGLIAVFAICRYRSQRLASYLVKLSAKSCRSDTPRFCSAYGNQRRRGSRLL